MNLTSCDGCGVVLDKDKLAFSDDIYSDDGSVNPDVAAWNSDSRNYEAYVKCPVCQEVVFK
jgi:hypothetical protein